MTSRAQRSRGSVVHLARASPRNVNSGLGREGHARIDPTFRLLFDFPMIDNTHPHARRALCCGVDTDPDQAAHVVLA
jgi:hypothetical protein